MTRATMLLLVARLRSHPWRSLVVVVAITVGSGSALSALAVLAVADDPWAPLVEATRGGDVERSRTVRVVGTAATTMMPNYPERVPGSVFAGDALYDAIEPVGPPHWSLGLRLHDPSRASEVTPGINEALSTETRPCASEDGGCARSSANVRANAFPSRAAGFAAIMLFFAVLMLIAATMLVVTLLGSRLLSEARELTLLQVAGVTPGRSAVLVAAEHAVLAAVGVVGGALVARVVAPRIADSAATVFGSVSPSLTAALPALLVQRRPTAESLATD